MTAERITSDGRARGPSGRTGETPASGAAARPSGSPRQSGSVRPSGSARPFSPAPAFGPVRPFDVACLGESMVTFLPSRGGRLADVPSFDRAIGGAESNVACALAGSGHRVRWISRVGTDGFGDHLLETIAARGVEVDAVVRDAARPTGIYFRTNGERATGLPDGAAEGAGEGEAGSGADAGAAEVAYYRAGSAASAMSPDTVGAEAGAARVLHLTGITAALSDGCRALLRSLTAHRGDRPLISFDVNYRAGLHTSSDAGLLHGLARDADLVFVGEDEAEAAWGVTGGPRAVREALPEPAVLVVKQGAAGATAFIAAPERAPTDVPCTAVPGPVPTEAPCTAVPEPVPTDAPPAAVPGPAPTAVPSAAVAAPASTAARAGAVPEPAPTAPAPARVTAPSPADASPDAGLPGKRSARDVVVSVPAPRVEVVAAVGAGDGFAAGFLSATLRGLPVRQRLRHGHLAAAAVLTVPGDLAEPLPPGLADRLAGLDDQAWGTLRLGPGWAAGADSHAERASAP